MTLQRAGLTRDQEDPHWTRSSPFWQPSPASLPFLPIHVRDVRLARVEFDHLLLVDHGVQLFPFGKTNENSVQLIAIHIDPVRDGNRLSEIEQAHPQLLRTLGLADFDHIPSLHLIRGNVDTRPVHFDMPMIHKLPSGPARIAKSHPEGNIVEATLEQLKENITSHSTAALRLLEIGAELLLHDAILPA